MSSHPPALSRTQVAKGTRVTAMCVCEAAAQLIVATERTGSVSKLTSIVSTSSAASQVQAEVVGLEVEEEDGMHVPQRVWTCDLGKCTVSALAACRAPASSAGAVVAVADAAGNLAYIEPAPAAHRAPSRQVLRLLLSQSHRGGQARGWHRPPEPAAVALPLGFASLCRVTVPCKLKAEAAAG